MNIVTLLRQLASSLRSRACCWIVRSRVCRNFRGEPANGRAELGANSAEQATAGACTEANTRWSYRCLAGRSVNEVSSPSAELGATPEFVSNF
jgi:hypothetical protein